MVSNAQDQMLDLYEDGNLRASIGIQRRRQEDAESAEAQSDSDDEVTRELMAGFEDASDSFNESEPHNKASVAVSTNPSAPLLQGFSSAPVPTPPTNQIAPSCGTHEDDDSKQEFEDISPLSSAIADATKPTSETPTSSSPTQQTSGDSTTAQPLTGIKTKTRLLKGTKTLLNYHSLPRRYAADGAEIGYREIPPAEHTYIYASDTVIPHDDPYFKRGCLRRMVFQSDPVPEECRYKSKGARLQSNNDVIDYASAADKIYDWCRTRRGVVGATEKTLKDGKLPRHFVLKIGPPHGPNGEAPRIADRLKSTINHYFHTRLVKSYLTVEIEIPYISLAGTSYFDGFIKKIREVMENKKVRDRLTVQLAPESAQRYLDCDPAVFYPENINHKVKWQSKLADTRYIWALVQRGMNIPMPHGWTPSPWDIDGAKQMFLKSSKITEEEQKGHVRQAIKDVNLFVVFVRDFEAGKEIVTDTQHLGASTTSSEHTPLSFPVVEHHTPVAGGLQSTQPPRAGGLLSTTSPSNRRPAPRLLTPVPAPQSLHDANPHDEHSSTMSLGGTAQQQATSIRSLLQERNRQRHYQMEQYQHHLQQMGGTPAAPNTGLAAASSARQTNEEYATDAEALADSSAGKRRSGDEPEGEHMEKRSKQ